MTLQPDPVPYPRTAPPDDSSLQVLGIFYYVISGLYVLVGFVPMIWVLAGLFVGAAGTAGAQNANDAGAAATVGGVMVCFGIFCGGIFWLLALLNFLAGSGLRKHKRLMLCYVMAALACLNFPFGTVLGVFTFVTVSKPGVKELFR